MLSRVEAEWALTAVGYIIRPPGGKSGTYSRGLGFWPSQGSYLFSGTQVMLSIRLPLKSNGRYSRVKEMGKPDHKLGKEVSRTNLVVE